MKSVPTLTKTELLILEQLVGNRELYGLEIIKKEPRLKRGTIYVLLGRLEEKGFVKSRQRVEANVSGLPRRVYAITGAGVAVRQAHRALDEALKHFGPAGETA